MGLVFRICGRCCRCIGGECLKESTMGLKEAMVVIKDIITKIIRNFPDIMDDYFKPALVLVSVITAFLLFLRLPVFLISDIEITGNIRLTDEYVKQAMNIRDGESIFFWNAPMARRQLMENHYVDRLDIDIDYRSRHVTVKIRERILSGYVEHVDGIFLYIDERGRVLETATSFTERLPVVVGLEFSQFTIGEILKVDNPISFDLVVTLAQLFNKYQVSSDIIKIDVSNPDDIYLYIGKIVVEFGCISGAEEKIRMVMAIMEEYLNDIGESGFLNIRDINRPPRFRPLQ